MSAIINIIFQFTQPDIPWNQRDPLQTDEQVRGQTRISATRQAFETVANRCGATVCD